MKGTGFARSSGAEIVSAGLGEAECRLALEDRHMNANSVPMGGAIFTLADFAYGVAANGCSGRNSVSQHVSITYLAPPKGNRAHRPGLLHPLGAQDLSLPGDRHRRAGDPGSLRHRQWV